MLLNIARIGKKLTVTYRQDGQLPKSITSSFNDENHFSRAASTLGLPNAKVKECVFSFINDGITTFDLRVPFVLRIRGIYSSDVQKVTGHDPVQLVRDATARDWGSEEPIAFWEDETELAALDVDASGWDEMKLRLFLEDFHPRPSLSWVTRSEGIRFIFKRTSRFAANEIASVAFLRLFNSIEYRSMEIKNDTRLPVGPVQSHIQTEDFSSLKVWLHDYHYTDERVQKYLADRGFEVGKRYPHDRCPICPTGTGRSDCVVVAETGIKCFVCEAHGISIGNYAAGWFPYSAIADICSRSSTAVFNCVRGKCHWAHVKYIMEDRLKIGGKPATLVYSTMLKAFHKDLGDTQEIFQAGKDLLRMEGCWTNEQGKPYTRGLPDVLAPLPAYKGLDGKPKKSLIAKGTQTFDLEADGYPALSIVFGLRVCRETKSRYTQVAVPTNILSSQDREMFRPKYIPNRNPADVEAAWQTVERIFPGLVRGYIKLLIVGKGFAEAQIGMTPLIMATGPTGSAKTNSVKVAAAIAGDAVTEPVWSPNIDRVRQSIKDSKTVGTFVCFNEIWKEINRSGHETIKAADFILNLTPDSMSWQIWIGPQRMGNLPVIIFTDIAIPRDVMTDQQLGRRIIHVPLPSYVDWKGPVVKEIGLIEELRVANDGMYAEACNLILSDIIDEFFTTPTTFEDSAVTLGFNLLTDSVEANDMKDSLKTFFKIVNDNLKDGWALIDLDHDSDLSKTWFSIANSINGEGRMFSMKAEAQDWQKLCELPEQVHFEMQLVPNQHNKIKVRFVRSSLPKPSTNGVHNHGEEKVNQSSNQSV